MTAASLENESGNASFVPVKLLLSKQDLSAFLEHPDFKSLLGFLEDLVKSIEGLPISAKLDISEPSHIDTASKRTVFSLLKLLDTLSAWIDEIKPAEQGSSRFGNIAFRDWYDRLAHTAAALLRTIIPPSLDVYRKEVARYLQESFGDRARIVTNDINFTTSIFIRITEQLTFRFCLKRLDLIAQQDYRFIVLNVFHRYLVLMRKLQFHYWHEPAGSHGVWGLDDYHFLPFLFGASQLVGHKYIRPKSIHDKDILDHYANEYMYLACIQFVNSVKAASLPWHSPMLNDISGVKTWEKVRDGLLKMYRAEVVGKLPIMQHFLIGRLIGSREGGIASESNAEPFQPPSGGQRSGDVSMNSTENNESLPPNIVRVVTSASGKVNYIQARAVHDHGCPIEQKQSDASSNSMEGVYAMGQEFPVCCGMRIPSAVAAASKEGAFIPFD